MKKLILFPAAAIMLFFTIGSTYAQFAANAGNHRLPNESSAVNSDHGTLSNNVNLRALKNFNKSYRQASNAAWALLRDKSQLCVFSINKVQYRAFYNPNGSWSYTVSSYNDKKLDKAIHEKIQSVYYDYRIVYINQIDMPGQKTIYLVEIQDEKSIKKVRLADDEMEVVQDFKK